MVPDSGIRGVDAYSLACRTTPVIERRATEKTGISLYGWEVRPDKELHVPRSHELTLAVHLNGAPRVRVFTPHGVSRRYSRPGDITLIPRGQSISYLTDGEVEFATAHFPLSAATLFRDRAGDRLLNLPHCLFALRDDYVVSSVRTLMRAHALSARNARHYAAHLLHSLAWHLVRVVDEGNAEPLRLAQQLPPRTPGLPREPDFEAVLAQMDAQLGERMRLSQMADHAGIGRTSFCEKFTQRFGCSPHRFILRRRIEKAKLLLREGRSSVTAIAYELGFSSPSHFSKAFRSATQLAPQAYAAQAGTDPPRNQAGRRQRSSAAVSFFS